jgi:hypothetical protein
MVLTLQTRYPPNIGEDKSDTLVVRVEAVLPELSIQKEFLKTLRILLYFGNLLKPII